MPNSRPLARVQRHQRDAVAAVLRADVHDERDMLEETLQGLELVHEADQLFQVLQPRLRLRALVVLPHLRVAGLVQDQLGELGVLHAVDLAAPALEGGDADRPATCARWPVELFRLDDFARGLVEGNRARPGQLVTAAASPCRPARASAR